jgi:hypothetical protein
MTGKARMLTQYHKVFFLNPGFPPKSDQSLVIQRMSNDTSIGAMPHRINPRPGDDGLPPSVGAIQATALTRTEKITMRQIILLRSVLFTLTIPFLLNKIDVHYICF